VTRVEPDSVLRQAERTASRVLDGRAVVVVIDRQHLHTLNRVGTRIWELCGENGRSVGELADALAREFEVDRATALADVLRFAEELLEVRALELGKGAGA
jgi:hypothetical protein